MVSASRAPWLVGGLAFLLPLLFAAFTHHAWEDYFITLRSSQNLVSGHGLVFNPGERVHTFTSPLGVLVPALCTWITGPGHETAALWLFRVINAAALATAAVLLWRCATALNLRSPGRWLLFGIIITDAKLVDFSINGMETALLVLFAMLLWTELESVAGPRITRIAIAVGGLMWTRPDAFVLGAALFLPHLVIRSRDATAPPPIRWRTLAGGILLGALLYVPWFAWAWWYYGTPVPHTITAKSAYTAPLQLTAWLKYPLQTLAGDSPLLDLFLPVYWTWGGWPTALRHVSHALVGIAAFAWLVPRFSPTARRASLGVFIGMFYLCSIILFPWYVPPWTVLAAIALAFVFDQLYAAAMAAQRPAATAVVRLGIIATVAVQAAILIGTAWQMRIQQHVVETPVRRAIGEWLKQNSAAGDTVFLEPLGYIGYFSQLKTYDFPGLSSPEVVTVVRSGARRYADIIARLSPQWLVLRPHETVRPEFQQTGVLRHYELVREWNAVPELDRYRFLPGRPWMEAEAAYFVFRRKPSAPAPAR